MSQPRTTLIVILLAGDTTTANALDSLLYEVQSGINQWTCGKPPLVFCLYHRFDEHGGLRSFHYRIKRNTLRFQGRQLDPNAYPPAPSQLLEGGIEDQVLEFLSRARGKLPGDGPIRSIVAAHGFPALGFNPTLELTKYMMSVQKMHARCSDNALQKELEALLDRLQSSLATIKPAAGEDINSGPQLQSLLEVVALTGSPPSGFVSTPKLPLPDLSLDCAAAAVRILPRRRLQTLILHTCFMSGLEAISALAAVPHHIACETLMVPHMLLSDWFTVLGDPDASDGDLTLSCFKSLMSPTQPNALGCFSSHHTRGINVILNQLNTLGSRLSTLIAQTPNTEALIKIMTARGATEVTPHIVDIVPFCKSLLNKALVPTGVVQPLIEAVCELQLSPPVMNNYFQGSQRFNSYRGISIYFPAREVEAAATASCPDSFRRRAARWCEFVDQWLTVPAT